VQRVARNCPENAITLRACCSPRSEAEVMLTSGTLQLRALRQAFGTRKMVDNISASSPAIRCSRQRALKRLQMLRRRRVVDMMENKNEINIWT